MPRILDFELRETFLTLWIEVNKQHRVKGFSIQFKNCPASRKEFNYFKNVSELKQNETQLELKIKV